MSEEKPEALQWLKENKNESAFATNRFSETDDAIEAVQRLYDAGARKVRIGGILSEIRRIEREGGPYADTLYVSAPEKMENWPDFVCTILELRPDEISFKDGKFRLWWD